jgi:hypothetical protein
MLHLEKHHSLGRAAMIVDGYLVETTTFKWVRFVIIGIQLGHEPSAWQGFGANPYNQKVKGRVLKFARGPSYMHKPYHR